MLVAWAACADPVRIATYHGDFSRKYPGILVKDLIAEDAVPGVRAILGAHPDILLLTNFDYDAGAVALTALRDRLATGGLSYPYLFAARPNTGMPTGLDIDGDGRRGGPRDAQGFGWFSGQGGQAILSRYPLNLVQDHTALLWRDLPDTLIANNDPAGDLQRLSSAAHWAVRVETTPPVTLLTLAATPPVFDGPEDRNGRRNLDEVMLWPRVLAGKLGEPPPGPVIMIGNFNVDPQRGDGRHEAAQAVLSLSRLQDPLPGTPTVTWEQTGPMRVSYVLPDAGLPILDAGVTATEPDAGLHALVWVDLNLE